MTTEEPGYIMEETTYSEGFLKENIDLLDDQLIKKYEELILENYRYEGSKLTREKLKFKLILYEDKTLAI